MYNRSVSSVEIAEVRGSQLSHLFFSLCPVVDSFLSFSSPVKWDYGGNVTVPKQSESCLSHVSVAFKLLTLNKLLVCIQ